MEIYLAHTQGFCAGVASAIGTVERALETFGIPLYVYHDIVHNTSIVKDFKERGVIFVDDLQDVPEGSPIIFSAHGIPPAIFDQAKKRKFLVVDATCPLVSKVHDEAVKYSKNNIHVILIGHKSHQEIIGTAGYVNPELLHIVKDMNDIERLDLDPRQEIGYLTQTTLSMDDTAALVARLREKFPNLVDPPAKDICYATQNRQNAVKELAKICDLIIVCGSHNSSNCNRLKEAATKQNVKSFIVDTADEFDVSILEGKQKIGLTSGASVPRYIVDEVVKKIRKAYPAATVHTSPSPEKKIVFPIPEF